MKKSPREKPLRYYRCSIRNKHGDVVPAEETASSVEEARFHFEARFGAGSIVEGPEEFTRDPRDERPLL